MKLHIKKSPRSRLALVMVAGSLAVSSVIAVTWMNRAAASTVPIGMEDTSGWIQTSWGADREISRCPADQVMVGVKLTPAEGLRKSKNFVKCAQPALGDDDRVYVYPGGTPVASGWLDQVPDIPETFRCDQAPMIASLHLGDYQTKGESQYRCAPLVVESAPVGEQLVAKVADQRWSGWISAFQWEEDHTAQLDFEYTCPTGSAITAREHQKSPHGVVRFQCTTWKAESR
uniref:Uncharacterized protein n=1 Tax=Neobacillus citreus TaxID=2833578 RepID=A0A942T1N7_9BACI